MNTDRLASFVAAAEAGSLSRAAERLGQQVSGLSRHVTELEADLGVKVFERTGRGVRLTSAGEQFLDRARTVLGELEQARAELRAGPRVREPSRLRLSTSPDVSLHVMPGVLAELLAAFPSLSVELQGETRRVAVVEESYDAVVRLGPLRPSELIATRLGGFTGRIYAPPEVRLRELKDLSTHEFVLFHNTPTEIPMRVRGRAVTLKLRGRARVNSFAEAADLAARTGRLVILPSFAAQPWLESGKLRPGPSWFPVRPVEAWLLRAPRHRGSKTLDALAAGLTRAFAAAEQATQRVGRAK